MTGGRGLTAALTPVSDADRVFDAVDRLAVYREIVANSTEAIAIVDRNGRYHEQNAAHRALFGYADAELRGLSPAVHLGAEVCAVIAAELDRTGRWHGEVASRTRDGRDLDIEVSAFTIRDAAGAPVCHVEIKRDVTERKRAEVAAARLAAIVESSDDAIIGKTLTGEITNWNPGSERLYGYAAEEVVGRSIAVIIPPERAGELTEIMSRLERGERIAHFETVRRRKDGRAVDVSVSIAPIRDGRGRIVGASTISRDISARRAYERKQHEFLTMVAHDLRSPLTAIKGYGQLLRRRGAYHEPAIAAVLSQVQQMERLVNDVLDVTRFDAGHLALNPAPVDLVSLVHARTAHTQELTERHDIRVETPDHPVIGEWDGDRIGQVIENLLSNAVKYAPEGEVVVRVEDLGTEARVSVRDEGIGIAAEDLPQVFDRFFRAGGPQPPTKGVGLGLHIARSLVDAHAGRIWVESQVGRGSTFTFSLPYGQAADRPDGQPRA